jgi:hypothetical protein
MEKIFLSLFMKILKEELKCQGITSIHSKIGRTAHSKDNLKSVLWLKHQNKHNLKL